MHDAGSSWQGQAMYQKAAGEERVPIPPECHQELSKNRLEQGHTSIRLRTNPNQTKLWTKSLARTWLREERPEKDPTSSYRSSSLQFFIHDIITAERNLRAALWGHRRLPKGRSRFLFQFFPIWSAIVLTWNVPKDLGVEVCLSAFSHTWRHQHCKRWGLVGGW